MFVIYKVHIRYRLIWANYNDLTVLPNPGIMVNKRNHPQMAELFRLVKSYNLPRNSYNVAPPVISWFRFAPVTIVICVP